MFLVMVTFSGLAMNVAATDIENLTTTITDLFIDLIPLIVILGVFGMIMAMIKLRK
jgi:hypothetical protein